MFICHKLNLQSTVDLSQVTVRNHLWRLVANADLETRWAPVNELDGSLCLESGNSTVDVVRDNITTVQQACSHVLSIAGVTLHHLVVGLEAGHRNLLDRVRFVGSLGSRDNWGISNKGEMNARVGDQVGLELVEVNIKRTVESEGGGDGRHDWA